MTLNEIGNGAFLSEVNFLDNGGGADSNGEYIEIFIPTGTDLSTVNVNYTGGNGRNTVDVDFGIADFTPGTMTATGQYFFIFVDPLDVDLNNSGTITLNIGGVDCQVLDISTVNNLDNNNLSIHFDPATETWEADVEGPGEPGPNQPPCFVRGTLISTRSGYIKVEGLEIGMELLLLNGSVSSIKWIGKRDIDLSRNPYPADRSIPIKIQADTFGRGLPSTDLYLSPDHGIYYRGLLINAGALVNDVTIRPDTSIPQISYYHIELDRHEVIFANDMPAESYLPQNAYRSSYDNSDDYYQRYGETDKLFLWPLDLPRISARNKVPEYISEELRPIWDKMSRAI